MMAICDRVTESKSEIGVFNLRGVRQSIAAHTFPYVPRSLWLFLVLSSPRPGEFPGYVRVLQERTDKAVFFAHLARPAFGADGGWLASITALRCRFPEAGLYTVQAWFFQAQGNDILKGEMPFVIEAEESQP